MTTASISPASPATAAFWRERASFLKRAAVALVITAAVVLYLSSRFTFVYDIQAHHKSMPWTAYLIDRSDVSVERGGAVAFRAKGLIAPFHDGMLFAKMVAAVPGDYIEVREDAVFVNGAKVKDNVLTVLGKERGTPVYIQLRSETVPDGKYFAVGTHDRSYDSRFWGYLDASQIAGRVIPLW